MNDPTRNPNEAAASPNDGSPDSGTVAPGPDSTDSQARGNGQPAEDIKSIVARAVRDALHADARRADQGKIPKTKTKDSDSAPSAFDPVALRGLDRALTRAGYSPNESQYKRMEKAFIEEGVSDADGWVRDYFDGLGVAKTATQIPHPATQLPANENPVSNRGTPPPSRVPIEEANMLTMSDDDRKTLLDKIGLRAFNDRLRVQMRDVQVITKK